LSLYPDNFTDDLFVNDRLQYRCTRGCCSVRQAVQMSSHRKSTFFFIFENDRLQYRCTDDPTGTPVVAAAYGRQYQCRAIESQLFSSSPRMIGCSNVVLMILLELEGLLQRTAGSTMSNYRKSTFSLNFKNDRLQYRCTDDPTGTQGVAVPVYCHPTGTPGVVAAYGRQYKYRSRCRLRLCRPPNGLYLSPRLHRFCR